MSTKTGRRNLRHARIGEQSASDRSPFTKERIATRLLCVEFNLPGDDPEGQQLELFFRPIPASVVMKLQGLSKNGNNQETIFSFMLDILAKYVVDPQTGQSVATAEEWDQFGIDGIQAAIQAMVDGSRGEGQGPTSAASTEAVYQAAKEMMQGDPEMAAAFRKAAEEVAIQTAETEAEDGTEAGKTLIESPETAAAVPIPEPDQNPIPDSISPTEVPNGTSDETP
jgi:hypothetical protein